MTREVQQGGRQPLGKGTVSGAKERCSSGSSKSLGGDRVYHILLKEVNIKEEVDPCKYLALL